MDDKESGLPRALQRFQQPSKSVAEVVKKMKYVRPSAHLFNSNVLLVLMCLAELGPY